MDQLAYDLILHLHEPGVRALLARITERVPGAPLPGIEQGVLRCRVEEVLRGPGEKVGNVLLVGYSRKTESQLRARSSINYWNLLPLEAGDLLALVGRSRSDGTWQALSGNQVASAADPAVRGLRESCRIEDLPAESESQRRQALLSALLGSNAVLRHYAIEAICRRQAVSREVGCDILVRAIESDQIDDDGRLRCADALTSVPIFDEVLADDAVNRKLLVALAHTIARLQQPQDQVKVVRYLASCVLNDFAEDRSQDRRIRSALLQAIGPAPPTAIAGALERMGQSGNRDDQETAQSLVEAWKPR